MTVNFNRIKKAIYATYLTNWYGFKLKRVATPEAKKQLRIDYSRKMLEALKIDVAVEGREKLPQEGRYLLVSNHRSIIDPVIIELALEETEIFGLWVSKKELYNSFFFGLFTRSAGSILLDRDAKEMSSFFKDVKTGVDAGNSIFVFPEGKRNQGPEDLCDFKDGARIIAMKNRLPILPIYIKTRADEALESALKVADPAPQTIIVEIGDIIDYKDRSSTLEEAYRAMFGLTGVSKGDT